ncbi:hypothetical protein BGZ58_000159 [Dissophora ornata]|nr:hypothetical protein BGZ58_000159 [Dissophora ornata]
MTSIASSKGDVGAEMLSSQIGAYFDIAIRIIEYHGGDVVKVDPACDHDSDELTTTTTTNSEDPAAGSRRNKVLVRKAIECGLELLARLSNYKIYLSEKEFARKLSTSEDTSIMTGVPGAQGPVLSLNDDNYGVIPNGNQGGNGNVQWNNYATSAAGAGAALASSSASISGSSFLSVPVMRSSSSTYHGQSGQTSNGGSGINSRRSSVPTESFSPVLPARFTPGNNLDSTGGHYRPREDSLRSISRPGSITSRHHRAGAFLATAKNFFTNSNFSDRQAVLSDAVSEDSHDLQLHLAMSAGLISNIIIGDIGQENGLDNLMLQTTGRLEYAICGEQMATIDDALNMARAGELTISASAWNFVSKDSYPWFEPRRNCYILKNIQPADDHPLLRRIRNDKMLNSSMESNPHYYKYINKSAIHRLILHPDGTFPAQFRTVTILFVSLGDVKPWTPEGLATCQKAICEVHHVTSEYEGFIQQFAVDDKGATLLCAFGLPYPRSHEREAVFAAKSAWVIRHRLLAEGIRGFKISLATGVIFTSMIGNEFRRDPAIVGDTIVIAVRILKFEYATESVVCDDATKEACTSDHDDMCEFEGMGEEFVKGKILPLRIWKLVHFGAKKQIRRPEDSMVDETIGYEPEREKVAQFIKSWETQPDKNTILVSGPKGSGKSIFYQQICHIADRNGYRVCSAASVEVEKSTEYYLCKFLLLGLFDIMKKQEIPYKPTDPAKDLGITFGELDSQRQQPATGPTFETSVAAIPDASSRFSTVTDGSNSPIPSQFGPSVRSSINLNSPWPLSPTGSQFGDRWKRNSSLSTKLQALISLSLQKMGESLSMAPNLLDIISSLACDNTTPVTNSHDDGMLANFIVWMLNYASEFVKIIVIFEDVQWTDEKSKHIIHVIHEHCPKVLVVIFSRPQRDYGGNILHCVTGHPKHLGISLEGLKCREIEQALLKAFEDKCVTKISPEVIQFVQEKTNGNPKFVKNMAYMLKDFYIVNIVDGELLTTGQESKEAPSHKNMEAMLIKQDRKKMILMQYDRMPAKFQEFLKIASCLGGQFSLAEVAAVRPLESLLGSLEPGKSFMAVISDTDKYRFLSLEMDQLTNVQFSNNVAMNTVYSFTLESTATYIYESIPYEERVSYHSTMGQFYESFLDLLQVSDLLPLIKKHYIKTDRTEKKIKYLKAVSSYYLKSNMLLDASQSLDDLINILDTERDTASMVSQEDMAEIYGMKGEALSKRMRIEEAEIALLDSLARYGIQWPKTPQQWRVTLFMERTKFSLHHGGSTLYRQTGRVSKAKVDAKTQVIYQRIIRVLGCLQNVYFWRTEPQAAMLSILYTLNYSRRLGIPSIEQTVSLGRFGLLCYLKGNKHTCMEYMDKAQTASDAGEGTEGMLPSMRAYVEYCEGNIDYAHELLSDAINECKSFGVVSNLATYYRSVTMKCAYRMWEGSFSMLEDSLLLRAMSTVAIQNGDYDGETLFAIPTLASLLLQDRLRDAESWVVLIERFIMPKCRLMNELVVHAMLSYYYAKMGVCIKAKMFAELMAERILEQGAAANPFPMMSCTFTVMALYEMFDCSSPPSILATAATVFGIAPGATVGAGTMAESRLCLGDVDQILRPVIQCLSEDPFQAIGQCFVILAEALRCFASPGHNREGFQKLSRGWERMKDKLEGINFVRAYFLTKLGQHAESPEVKDEYYNEAYVLLRKIGINTSGWLTNPTPGWQHPQVEGYPLETILSLSEK